jgi:hypothetical protein
MRQHAKAHRDERRLRMLRVAASGLIQGRGHAVAFLLPLWEPDRAKNHNEMKPLGFLCPPLCPNELSE